MSKKEERRDEDAKPRRGGGHRSKQAPATDVVLLDINSYRFGVAKSASLVRENLGEDSELIEEIDATIRVIGELRASTREDDKEMARLGEETRRLIAQMQKELKVA